MKPKEYIKKYNIQSGWNPKHQKHFLSDLTSEFLAILECNRAHENINGFNNAVKTIRMKWDGISAKICYGLPEGLWNYFFATVIAKLREELCPKAVAQMERIRAERHQERIRRQQIREQREKQVNEMFNEYFFERYVLMMLLLSSCPRDSFEYFNLPTTASEEEVRSVYKSRVISCHPDHGGSAEEFVKLTEHKNKCLKWVSK